MQWVKRWSLPLLSGVLIAASLYPLYLWPLAPVALAPLFYFSFGERSRRERFIGGFCAGVVAVAPTLWFSLAQLEPQPGASLLTLAVRASSLFFLVFIGALFGALAAAVGELRSQNPLRDTLAAAALYTVLEQILFFAFGGYYYASLAHALAPLALARAVASVGGVPLLIFAAAWFSASLARAVRGGAWRALALCALCIAAVGGGASWYAAARAVPGPVFIAAVIQRTPESLLYVTAPPPTPFGDYPLQVLITQAATDTPLVVYPFSPVEATYIGAAPALATLGALEPDATIGEWLARAAPASTTVLLWNTVAEDGKPYDEFELWHAAARQVYQKHELYALSDYTPRWLKQLGMARLPYEIAPGVADDVSIEGVNIGGLACSELQQESYVRSQARGRDLLLAVGFDGFFPGPLAGQWSLEAARLRAAENGTPLLRSSLFGPSAFIAADGSVVSALGYGQSGILAGSLSITKRPTLFTYAGEWPAWVLIVASLAWVLELFIMRVDEDLQNC
jgi:apolipoprotein N-acyltransferase